MQFETEIQSEMLVRSDTIKKSNLSLQHLTAKFIRRNKSS